MSFDLKNRCRSLILGSAHKRPIYSRFWHPLMRLCAVAQKAHQWDLLGRSDAEMTAAEKMLSSGIVLHGPFQGMKYPQAQSSGSSLYPKLIGSYERELHPILDAAIAEPYTDVIDVGCAEGYYAVGFALRKPESRVWAFDTNATARELCQSMARANGVELRLSISARCDAAELCHIPVSGRALVFCDCEGFEKQLFSPETCRKMAAHDFLIEVHDFIKPFLSADLLGILTQTHRVQRVWSIPDLLRPTIYHYDELKQFSDATRIALLAESRPMQMEWFFCRSRLTSLPAGLQDGRRA